MTRRYDPFRRPALTARELAILAAVEPIQPQQISRTDAESLAADLRPVLDPFPFHRDIAAETHIERTKGLLRLVYTADAPNPDAVRSAARAAGWEETTPDHFTCPELALLLVRTTGSPNAALIIDTCESMRRWNAAHAGQPLQQWPNVPEREPKH